MGRRSWSQLSSRFNCSASAIIPGVKVLGCRSSRSSFGGGHRLWVERDRSTHFDHRSRWKAVSSHSQGAPQRSMYPRGLVPPRHRPHPPPSNPNRGRFQLDRLWVPRLYLTSSTNTAGSRSASPTSTKPAPPPVTAPRTTAATTTTTAAPATTVPKMAVLAIRDFAFVPSTLVIAVDTTVSVTNHDTVAHTWTSNLFDSGPIQPGSSFKVYVHETGHLPVSLQHPSLHDRNHRRQLTIVEI